MGKLLLINVYLPSVRSAEDQDALYLILCEIDSFIANIDCNYVVIAGDFNCNVTQCNATSKLINDWMADHNLTLANKLLSTPSTITHTFSGKSRDAYSLIDHFYVSNSPANLAHSIKDIDANENFSDHIPIVLNIDSVIYDLCKQNNNLATRHGPSVVEKHDKYENVVFDWENSTKSDYYNLTRDELSSLSNLFLISDINILFNLRPDIFTQNGLNNIYRNIVHALFNASLKTIKIKSKKSFCKHWWDSSLTAEKKESKKQFEIWSNAGKPKNGSTFIAKCAARKKYRNALFRRKTESKNHVGEKLQNNLIKSNPKQFWKFWNGCFKKAKASESLKVNGLCDKLDIADYLADEFASTCTPNDEKLHADFKRKYLLQKTDNIGSVEKLRISVQCVNGAIERIEYNKAAGFDHITVEHIAYAHPCIIVILARLFEIMLYKGLVPDDFGIGITTPIPKFKGAKKVTTADDYRGITICPVISKIFEHCIIGNFETLKTSDRQFGFKKNVGCYNSIHTIRKVVKFFNNRNSTVNIGSIDLRKAFDKTNIYGILCMLQDKCVNKDIVSILENWFLKNSTSIKWQNIKSHDIPLMSGVKQGGILSPLLFTLYVDIVLEKLENSKLGCFIGYKCYNSFMYADDLMLLSITVTDLQRLFDMCCTLFSNLDLPINISKCHCLRIGPRYNVECKNITIHGEDISWVKETRFLGVTITNNKAFKCSWDAAKRKFYCNSNIIIGRLGTSAPVNVLLKLLDSQAISHLLYGISATTLSSKDMNSLSYAYNNIFAKIFHSLDNKVILNCQYYSSSLPFNYLYDYHRYNFLNKLFNANLIDLKSEVDAVDVSDYQSLQLKYNLKTEDSRNQVKYKIWQFFENVFLGLLNA